MKKRINLDSNAAYGVHPEVSAFLQSQGFEYLNPSSIHQSGQVARAAIENARDQIRSLLGLTDKNGFKDNTAVIFNSGATESNTSALFSPFWSYLAVPSNGSHSANPVIPELIISAVEHPSVYESAMKLRSLGVVVHVVSPRSDHQFYAQDFAQLVNPRTKLVSVMAVNNETGLRLPIAEICKAVKSINPRTLVHTDGVQLLGKIAFSFHELGVDMLSISGHKIGGISGVGALIVKAGIEVDPVVVGGAQETGRRAGTENLLGITALGKAAAVLKSELDERTQILHRLSERLKNKLLEAIPSVTIWFDNAPKIGNTVSAMFAGISTSDLVVALDLAKINVSSGSACSSGKTSPSAVLLAHGLTPEQALSTIRISVNHYLTEEDIDDSVERFRRVVSQMQSLKKAA